MGKGSGSCTTRAPLAFGGVSSVQSSATDTADGVVTTPPVAIHRFNPPATPELTDEQHAQILSVRSFNFRAYCQKNNVEPEEVEVLFDSLVGHGLMSKTEQYSQTSSVVDRTISYIRTSYGEGFTQIQTMRSLDLETVAVLEAFAQHRRFANQAAIAHHSGISRKAVSAVINSAAGKRWMTHVPKTSHWSPAYYGLNGNGQSIVTSFGPELVGADAVKPIDVPHGGFVDYPDLTDADINTQAQTFIVNTDLDFRSWKQRLGITDDNQAEILDPLVTAGYLKKSSTTYHSVTAEGYTTTNHVYYHKTELADNERGENSIEKLGIAAQEILFYYASTAPGNTAPRAVPQPDFVQQTGMDADAVRTGLNQLLSAGYAENFRNPMSGYGVGLNTKGRWLLKHARRLHNS